MDEMFQEMLSRAHKEADRNFVNGEIEIVQRMVSTFGEASDISEKSNDVKNLREMNAILIESFKKKLESCDFLETMFRSTGQTDIQKSLARITACREYCAEVISMINMMDCACIGAANASKAYYKKLEESYKEQYKEDFDND